MQIFWYSIISKKAHNEIISWVEKVVKENVELKMEIFNLKEELETKNAKIKDLKITLRCK